MSKVLSFASIALVVASSVYGAAVPRAFITDGFATFFGQNGLPGACGIFHQDQDFIGAISDSLYGPAARSPLCGQQVQIVNPANGNSVVITIADDCPACQNDSFDLSIGAFEALAPLSDGRIPIEWQFV